MLVGASSYSFTPPGWLDPAELSPRTFDVDATPRRGGKSFLAPVDVNPGPKGDERIVGGSDAMSAGEEGDWLALCRFERDLVIASRSNVFFAGYTH